MCQVCSRIPDMGAALLAYRRHRQCTHTQNYLLPLHTSKETLCWYTSCHVKSQPSALRYTLTTPSFDHDTLISVPCALGVMYCAPDAPKVSISASASAFMCQNTTRHVLDECPQW